MWLLISLCVVGAVAMRPMAWPRSRGTSRTPGRRASRSEDADVARWAAAESTSQSPSCGADVVQEIPDDLDVAGPFFPHRQVGALLEPHELGTANAAMDTHGHPRRDLVVAADGHEGRDLDAWELVRHIPILDRADDRELVRSVHREVDRLARVLQSVREFAGPHREAAQVPPIEYVDRRKVRGG